MKTLLIVVEKMNLGGTEKALLAMLKVLPQKKFDVTIMLMSDGGELRNNIPKWINALVIPGMHNSSKNIIKNHLNNGSIINAIKSTYCLFKMKKSKYYEQYYYLSKALPCLKKEYDIAISYTAPGQFPVWYVANNIKAKKKVTWIHSDLSLFTGIKSDLIETLYSNYNVIFGVSKSACEKFKEYFPKLSDRVDVFYNIIDRDDIVKKSIDAESFNDNFGGVRILTVGRLSKEKGQDMIPKVLVRLLEKGYKVRWYCIGEGDLKGHINEEIEKYNISQSLILLGAKNNPYGFFNNCDVYVQPSRFEGYCITLAEAKCFNKPIVVTDFIGAKEQIVNEKNGFISELDADKLYKNIKKILDDKNIIKKFNLNLKSENISTNNEVKKLEYLIQINGVN